MCIRDRSTTDRLQPLTLDTCQQANPELTARAAFSMNVRTFVLVKDKKTFCSSATGEMDIPLNELIPALDINKNVDMAILPGTPMVPNKPAIVIWYRNPLLKNSGVFAALNLNLTPSLFYSSRQEDYDGVALIIDVYKRQAQGAQLPGKYRPARHFYRSARCHSGWNHREQSPFLRHSDCR